MARQMTKVNTTTEDDVEVTQKPKTAQKKFKNSDLIPCKSITNGELLMVGAKTDFLYKWANYGDVEDVEYQDLVYEIRSSRGSFASYPRFIILDNDFVAQNKQLDKIYEKLYSMNDLRDILNMPVRDMKRVIAEMPKGVQDSLKGLASTMINSGSFDSVSKIKALDELFGTSMLQTLVEQ